ncbi:ATP-grasp domain-containing protein [Evansella clarkii]|uniref:ATP-grasp domain-containing protein n=1 Tax=Evansella clarkii TaxID=79879 RepID=UPI0009963578|nr:ATP-grasp domain-containing protein [Evansella clarkii]
MNKYNVLIFPAGSETGIEIYNSLKYNLHFNVFGASGVGDHAKYIYHPDRYVEGDFLYITDENFIERFNKLIEEYKIDFIFPTHDSVALFLSENSHLINARLVCSEINTTRVARSKKETYRTLRGYDFIPKVYKSQNEVDKYPVFLKPDIGEGGRFTKVIHENSGLEGMFSKLNEFVICEYLPGEEFTVDCFTNRKGELLFAGPRTRERVTMGISFHSESTEINKEINEIAHTLNRQFKFRGAWFFQVKGDKEDKFKLMEFSVRQASTVGLYRQLGINFSLLSLFDLLEYDVEMLFNKHNILLDRCLKNSYKLEYYYNKIYIDFDDTLIVNGKVNTLLMRLIFQCLNNRKKVILLTKHPGDLSQSLKKYRISDELFDEIILIPPDKKKADYIDHFNAVFIDNYFFERKSVKEICGIPVFDVDAVECLLDEMS